MPLSYEDARHLLQRTGFGGRPADIEAATALERDTAARHLLADRRDRAVTPPPDWVDEPLPERPDSDAERRARQRLERQQAVELVAWWYRELCATPSPLTERLVLYWHGHFTSSLRKVHRPALLYRQNALFRRLLGGTFSDLLRAVARDPAMLLYLDTQTSTRQHPNENFARELLELFTLGEGHYTEEDVREAARAFTGWHVERRTGAFGVRRFQHDGGQKTFLGRTGRWDGDDILDILLEQPRLSEHITLRVWRAFVSPEPDPDQVAAIAAAFRGADYALPTLFEAVLASPGFWDPSNRGTLVKSPVELLVGTARVFDIAPDDGTLLARLGRRMGQVPFNPPTVAGWPGGDDWITSATLLERQRFLRQLARSPELAARLGEAGLAGWAGRPGLATDAAIDLARRTLLPIDPVYPLAGTADERQALERILADPTRSHKGTP
jgi:uncharacterized protein (DUF1800 family)